MTTAISPKRSTSIDPFTSKSRYSSDHIVDFMIALFKIPKSEFTNAIHKSLQNLDQLARNVDQGIDSDTTSVPALADLQSKVTECLLPLASEVSIKALLKETMKCVGESLTYNTTERSLVYSFTGPLVNHRTTLWYLYPLYVKLLEDRKYDTNLIKNFFILVTNYIQFLDDICDLIDDKEQNIVTPSTIHYLALEQNSSNVNQDTFKVFMENAGGKSYDFLTAIELIAESLEIPSGMFSEWKLQTRLIQLGQVAQEFPERKRILLKEFQKSLSQILCYADGKK